jgi:DNA-binding transcriptional LysR family regulator
MYPGIELRLFRYVIAIAKQLNFTRAAKQLFVAQPTLSKQIRDLEAHLGVKLFERSKREVRLTAAGEAFIREARQTVFHAERAVEAARTAKGLERDPFSLAYSPLMDLRMLSMSKNYFDRSHPDMEVNFHSAYTAEQLDDLLHGTLNAGFVLLPLNTPGLTQERLVRQALTVALPTYHPFARKNEIEMADFHRTPLITMRAKIEPALREHVDRVFRVAGVQPQVVQEATTTSEMLELVANRETPALTIPSAQNPGREGIVFRPVKDEFLSVETGIAFRLEDSSPRLNSFRKFLRETFRPLAADGWPTSEASVNQMRLF